MTQATDRRREAVPSRHEREGESAEAHPKLKRCFVMSEFGKSEETRRERSQTAGWNSTSRLSAMLKSAGRRFLPFGVALAFAGIIAAPAGAATKADCEERYFYGTSGYESCITQVTEGEAIVAREAAEHAPLVSLSVHNVTQGYHETYEIPGVTRVVIEPTPAPYSVLTYTDTANEHSVWRLLGGVTESVCPHNDKVQAKIGGQSCPTSLEYIEPSLNPPLDDPPGLQEGEPVTGAEVVIFWSCQRRIGQTIGYTVTAQRGEGAPLTYVGHYKNNVTHRWCHAAKRKEERKRRFEKAQARKKREAHERYVRETHEREIAAHRAEEERYERTCRAIGGVPVVVQNREGSWEIVCRSHAGGLLEVP